MQYTLTRIDSKRGRAPAPPGVNHDDNYIIEQAVRKNIVLTSLHELVNWGRKNSLWPYTSAFPAVTWSSQPHSPGCTIFRASGPEVIRASPRQADVMIIAGTCFMKMAPVVQRLYEQMVEPRWVISMGSCANSGGMYDIYSVVQGVDKFLPVDVYVPGCPPRPEAFIQGLMLLQDAVAHERRPYPGWSASRASIALRCPRSGI